MNADLPTPPGPRQLGEDQGMPGDCLVGFTRGLMDRREQLIRHNQPPETARAQAVGEAVQAFGAGADQRGWTVAERRIASLAGDALGLEAEYRDRHGYPPELTRAFAVGEALEGERVREAFPLPWWRSQADPSERTRPNGRADRARTREAGHER